MLHRYRRWRERRRAERRQVIAMAYCVAMMRGDDEAVEWFEQYLGGER